MQNEGVARVAFGPKTLGAMLLALVVYVVVSYVVMLALTLAAGLFASVAQWLLGEPNSPLVRFIGAVLGSVAGMWAARQACDMAFDAYQPRPVFLMFVVVLLAAAMSRVSGSMDAAQLVLGAQYLAALAAAFYYFGNTRSPISTTTTGMVRSD